MAGPTPYPNPILYEQSIDELVNVATTHTTYVELSFTESVEGVDTAAHKSALTRAEKVSNSAEVERTILDRPTVGDSLRLYVHELVAAIDRVQQRRTIVDAVIVLDTTARQITRFVDDGGTISSVLDACVSTKTAASDVSIADIQKMQMGSITAADNILNSDTVIEKIDKLIGHSAAAVSSAKCRLQKRVSTDISSSDTITSTAATSTISKFNVFQHTVGDIAFSTNLVGAATYNVTVKIIRVL